jgi:hypothetical protein
VYVDFLVPVFSFCSGCVVRYWSPESAVLSTAWTHSVPATFPDERSKAQMVFSKIARVTTLCASFSKNFEWEILDRREKMATVRVKSQVTVLNRRRHGASHSCLRKNFYEVLWQASR